MPSSLVDTFQWFMSSAGYFISILCAIFARSALACTLNMKAGESCLPNCMALFVISGFRCNVDEICALLGYYTASNGNP
jgi:hypothetical protein